MINPFKNKKGLGRGLSSLIGDSDIKDNKTTISISSIIKNKYQPRKKFEKESLEELTSSIKERGIIQPIIVRKSDDLIDKFEIVAGERRWQAAQKAGLHKVPVVVIEADNLKSLEFAIVENVQRKDLNSIEEAEGYAILNDKYNLSQKEIGRKVSKSRSEIANKLRLLRLPSVIQDSLRNGIIHYGHARSLISIQDSVKLLKIFKKIIAQKLTVRESEMLIKFNKKNNVKKIKNNNQHEKLEKKLINYLQTNLSIKKSKKNKGKIIIEFNTRDDLDKIISLILKK